MRYIDIKGNSVIDTFEKIAIFDKLNLQNKLHTFVVFLFFIKPIRCNVNIITVITGVTTNKNLTTTFKFYFIITEDPLAKSQSMEEVGEEGR